MNEKLQRLAEQGFNRIGGSLDPDSQTLILFGRESAPDSRSSLEFMRIGFCLNPKVSYTQSIAEGRSASGRRELESSALQFHSG